MTAEELQGFQPVAEDAPPPTATSRPMTADELKAFTPVASHVGTPPPTQNFLGDPTKPAAMHAPSLWEKYGPSRGTQRMIGGAAGALGALAVAPEITGPGLLAAGARAAIPAIGAAMGGGATAAVQGTSPTAGALEQGGAELGGQAVSWPLKAIGRRLLTGGVAERATQALDSKLADLKQRFVQAAPAGMSASQAGRATEAVVQGPAKRSLNKLGAAVETAAESGPDLNFAPIKARAQDLAAQIRPMASHGPSSDVDRTFTSTFGTTAGHLSTAEKAATLAKVGVTVEDTHPLPGVLQAIGDAPDVVPFKAAHQYKRLLDESVNWESPAKKQIQQITKATRNDLRAAMTGHQPYDQATQAYANALPLFTKGAAAKLHKAAIDNPESLIDVLKPNAPTRLDMLHEVLTTHATEGGGQAEGEQAWNGIRAAWTRKHFISGGVEKFDSQVQKIDPEFLKTMYGDHEGQVVLGNLQQISTAYQQALAQQEKLGQSSLVKTISPRQALTDVAHIAVAPHSPFTPARVADLALRGPKIKDLVEWAQYSPARTQLFVKAATNATPGAALTNLYRTTQLGNEDEQLATPPSPTR